MAKNTRIVFSVLLIFVLVASCGKKKAPEKQAETTMAEQLQTSKYPAAPDFTLKDMNGNEITLSKLRGKVVVVDFWATWCGPCVRSFPAMQQAVNKYKNDPDVEFLFVNTWERGGNVQTKVADFIKSKGYKVNVLFDLEYSVVKYYGVDGIPTKFIIDKKGGILHKSVGMFRGSDEAAVAELSKYIEEAKL